MFYQCVLYCLCECFTSLFCIVCVGVLPVCFVLFVWVFYQLVLYCLCECFTSVFCIVCVSVLPACFVLFV